MSELCRTCKHCDLLPAITEKFEMVQVWVCYEYVQVLRTFVQWCQEYKEKPK